MNITTTITITIMIIVMIMIVIIVIMILTPEGGDPPLAIPCTPAGCIELLQRSNVEVSFLFYGPSNRYLVVYTIIIHINIEI